MVGRESAAVYCWRPPLHDVLEQRIPGEDDPTHLGGRITPIPDRPTGRRLPAVSTQPELGCQNDRDGIGFLRLKAQDCSL